MQNDLTIGLMSGTSVDSIDAALVSISPGTVLLIKGISFKIPDDVRECIFELFQDHAGSLKTLTFMNFKLGELFSEAVHELLKVTGRKPHEILAVASHGQTIYHVANRELFCGQSLRGSLQIGEGAVIAERTGITTVSDFRTGDVAAGGAGAPLVPFLDAILAEKTGYQTAFQNIGGIGNVTYLNDSMTDPVAFDTGPGNMIVDRLVTEFSKGELTYDKDGKIGKTGFPNEALLKEWLKHPFICKSVPKTTGREEFGSEFYDLYIRGIEINPGLIRTAELYTARTIAESYKKNLPKLPERVIVTGGGAHNPVILDELKLCLPECRILTGDQVGISTDFKEAVAFALFGWCTLNKQTNTVPSATGALKKAVMGKVSYAF